MFCSFYCGIIKGIKDKIAKIKELVSITTVIPVVFVLGGIAANFFIIGVHDSGDYNNQAFFLGAAASVVEEDALLDGTEFQTLGFSVAESDEDVAGFVIVEQSALINDNSPLGHILPNRNGLITYKIQSGDTLSKIAANFGISLNTILWANNIKANAIKPGQEIVILPVSGVLHYLQESESLDSVAALYGVDTATILKYNPRPGDSLMIPGAKPNKSSIAGSSGNLPNLAGFFVIPTTGWNWGRIHLVNAIDIANACGTPIYAAAEGLIIIEKSSGWNDGYGHLIEIEHPNGVITRYAHTQKNAVSVGDYVAQGDLIAFIGNTGNTHGPTGCHLHFEVRGARNPFAK